MRVTRVASKGKKQNGFDKVCDECLKAIEGGAWLIHPPAEHPLSTETVLHLCSDACLMQHIQKSAKEYGEYKAKVTKITPPSKEKREDDMDMIGNR